MNDVSYLKCDHYIRLLYDCNKHDKICNDYFFNFLKSYSCHRYGFRY